MAAQPPDKLESLAERYWDAVMTRYPTRATSLGDYRFNDRLADLSQRGRTTWRATLSTLLAQVGEIPTGDLPPKH